MHAFVGGSAYRSTWTNKPESGAGIYYAGVPCDGKEGGVESRLMRGDKTVMSCQLRAAQTGIESCPFGEIRGGRL